MSHSATLERSSPSFAAILARATVYPWIVRVYCNLDDRNELFGGVCMSHDEPEILEFVPDGATVLWSRAYCATMFDGMSEQGRRAHSSDYREYLMFRKARAIGVEVKALRPWADYDPIAIDDSVDRWVATGVAR